MKQVLIIHYIF